MHMSMDTVPALRPALTIYAQANELFFYPRFRSLKV